MTHPFRIFRPQWAMFGTIPWTLVWAILVGLSIGQAAPQLNQVSPRGLRVGGTTTVTLSGLELHPTTRILLPVPIARQTVLPGAAGNEVKVEVQLAADVPPGVYPLRVASERGVSNLQWIGVDDLPQIVLTEPRTKATSLPAAFHGSAPGQTALDITFTGVKGQRLLADIEARRLGANFDAVLTLRDARRTQVAWAAPNTVPGGDTRLLTTLPAHGEYTLEVRDALYRGGTPSHFRLKLGDLHFADFTLPLGGKRGEHTMVVPIGSVPPQPIPLDLRSVLGHVSAPRPRVPGLTGAGSNIIVSDYHEAVESTPAPGKLQELTAPAAVSGQLSKPNEEDRYRFLVQPGTTYRIEMYSQRLGTRCDGVLTLYNDQGGGITSIDDRPGFSDPGLDYAVPANMKTLVVGVRDMVGAGGPHQVYRLAVTPLNQPEFGVQLLADNQVTPRGGATVMRVDAFRAGYQGAIQLKVEGLPPGVTVVQDTIPAGAKGALLTIQAPASQPLSGEVVRVKGISTDEPLGLERMGLLPSAGPSRLMDSWRADVGFAVTPAAALALDWEGPTGLLPLGYGYEARLRVRRGDRPESRGPVRLSLLTSQTMPRTPDNKADDVNRALRLEGVPMVAAAQDVGSARVLVPADLPNLPYDLAFKAELLTADGKSVLETVFSPSRRFTLGPPFRLEVAGAPTVQAKAGEGPTGQVTGKIVRAGGYQKPVTITLAGLPPEVLSPVLEVSGDKSDFTFPIAFPFGTKPGPLAGGRLIARGEIAPGKEASSEGPALAITVVPGNPPPPAPALLRVFEDESTFPALLFQGEAPVSMETVDRYSGGAALKLANGHRFRLQVPGWSFPIVEKPGPNQFRYVRFAWRKRSNQQPGSNHIAIQLAARGALGPLAGKPGPALRYDAGPDAAPGGVASIKVDQNLPKDWVVVTRDLFADFGAFTLTGIGFTAGLGEGLFDHVYLGRSLEDFKACPPQVSTQPTVAIFEDQPQFITNLNEGGGQASLEPADKYSGTSSAKITPDQRFNPMLPGLGIKIRQNPAADEFRYLRFAWKKRGGSTICLQLNHDGMWGPSDQNPRKFRYHAGGDQECYGASLKLENQIPGEWTVVTRDLYADFGDFTFTGIALSPVDGEYALFDHLYLAKSPRDFAGK